MAMGIIGGKTYSELHKESSVCHIFYVEENDTVETTFNAWAFVGPFVLSMGLENRIDIIKGSQVNLNPDKLPHCYGMVC